MQVRCEVAGREREAGSEHETGSDIENATNMATICGFERNQAGEGELAV